MASGRDAVWIELMEFITEVNSRLGFLSSKPRPVLPRGTMGNEPRNIPVMETKDAVRL